MKEKLRRIRALTVKEFREVLRDNSSLAMGLLLPLILILVIGYGISLDVKHAPIGVVLEDASPEAQQVVDFVDGSEYFQPTYLTSMHQAVRALEQRKIDAILRVPRHDHPELCGNGGGPVVRPADGQPGSGSCGSGDPALVQRCP